MARPSSLPRASGAGGVWTGNATTERRRGCSSALTAAAAMATERAPGNTNLQLANPDAVATAMGILLGLANNTQAFNDSKGMAATYTAVLRPDQFACFRIHPPRPLAIGIVRTVV